MSKVLQIFKTQVAIYFAYRLSFVLWRVRNILNFIIVYFLWNAIYSHRAIVFHYTQDQMMTYILLVGLMNAVVLATRTTDISNEIVSGDIINYLLKPLSFLQLVTVREFTDKLVNACFAVVEVSLFILLLKPILFIQQDIYAYLAFIPAILIGASITFFISFSLSLVAFWTSETWAPRFIYFILITMLAGTTFPLDILPKSIYNLLLLTPFPYLIYFPIKIYLHGLNAQTIPLFVTGIVWSISLYFFTKYLWNRGLKEFSFYGK